MINWKLDEGAEVVCHGYLGRVVREYLTDMYEVRLSRGMVVVPRSELIEA